MTLNTNLQTKRPTHSVKSVNSLGFYYKLRVGEHRSGMGWGRVNDSAFWGIMGNRYFLTLKALAKVDHAFGQLRQMKDGQLQGINAEELLVTIYDRSTFGRLQGKKSDQACISNRELRKLMKKNGLE